jgi:hypothetical protein
MSSIVASFIYNTGSIDFWENASVATLGDDNINGVSDEWCEHHNQVTLAKFLDEEMGMKYTPANKESDFFPYTDMSKVSFLKRRFKFVPGKLRGMHLTCPLEIPSILHSLYWVRESSYASKDQICRSMLEDALGELSLHGREIWNMYAPDVIKCMVELECSPTLSVTDHFGYLQYMLSRVDGSWGEKQIRDYSGKNTGA